jgi:hypothetical protein
MPQFVSRLSKVANVKLPSDPALWADRIMEHLGQVHPYLLRYVDADIDWSVKPIDEVSGTGVGALTATVNGFTFQIPIIVNDLQLEPLDIYFTNDGHFDILDKNVVLKNSIGGPIASLGQKILPHAHQTFVDGFTGTPSMFSKVASYANFKKDLGRVAGHLVGQYPNLKASFDRIEKYARADESAFDTLTMTDVGHGFKVAAFRKGHQISNTFVSRDKVYESLNSKLAHMGRLARGGAETFIERPLDKVAVTTKGTQMPKLDLKPGQTVEVKVEDGVLAGKLYLSTNIRNAHGPLSGRYPLVNLVFVSQDGQYSHNVPGLARATKKSVTPKTIPMSALAMNNGDTRGFIVVPDEGGERLIGPVVCKGQVRGVHNESRLMFRSGQDGVFYVLLGKEVKQIVALSSPPHTPGTAPGRTQQFLMPQSYKFIPVKEMVVPQEDVSEETKLASVAKGETALVELVATEDGMLCKCGSLSYNLSDEEAKAFLMSLGATASSADQSIKLAMDMEGEVVPIYGLERPVLEQMGSDDRMEPGHRKVAQLMEVWSRNRESLNKLANVIHQSANQDLQDSLSGMNLLNQYNAQRFADAIPEITEAKHVVADLLYKTRIGEVKGMNERVVRDALFSLRAILEGLFEISASNELH